MAYTAPPNFATGAVLTEAQLDILSDDITFLAGPPRARVYNNANISVANATDQALTFNSERFDTDTMHSTSVNTSRITFTSAGTYLVGGNAIFAANATGTRKIFVRLNGTTPIATAEVVNGGASADVSLAVSTLYTFAASDYIELVAFQNSTGSLNVTASGNTSPEFWATLIAVA